MEAGSNLETQGTQPRNVEGIMFERMSIDILKLFYVK